MPLFYGYLHYLFIMKSNTNTRHSIRMWTFDWSIEKPMTICDEIGTLNHLFHKHSTTLAKGVSVHL